MRICIIVFLVGVSMFSQNIFAQSTATTSLNGIPVNGGGGGVPELEEKVYYTVTPSKPKVGDLADIQVEMYGTPIQNAIFTWDVNGTLYKRAQGLSKISVYIEKDTKVSVSILTVNGTTLYKEWVFNPQNVVIFWEADTQTPPFYKGKSLYTPESKLVLQGINLDAKNPLTNLYANYVWKIDGKVQGSDSGVGRRTYTYTGDILQLEPLFELLYTNITNYQDTEKTPAANTRSILRVKTLETDIFAYEKTPLLGVLFNKIIRDTFILDKKEATVVAYPVYFSKQSSSNINYLWSINNNPVKEDVSALTFKRIRDNEKSLLNILVTNPKSLLQEKSVTYVVDTTVANSDAIRGFGK